MDTRLAVGLAAFVTLGIGGVLVGLVLAAVLPLNHDVGIYLQCAQLLLRGDLPYVDYIELNPPLTHYLHTLPVLAAQLLGAPLPMTFQVLVLGLALASAAALFILLQKSRMVTSRAGPLLVLAGWLAVSVYIYSDGGFGQREHLFLLAFAPWLALRVARYQGVSLRPFLVVAVALVVGVLMLLKPHFVVIACATELWMLVRTRRFAALRAPEVFVVIALAVLYAGHFLLLPDAVQTAFFQRWIPIVLEHYDAYNTSLPSLLARERSFWMLVLAGLILGAVATHQAPSGRKLLLEGLVLSLLLAIGSFLLQQKGWSYHRYPAAGFLGLLIVLSSLVLLERERAQETLPAGLRAVGRPVAFIALLVGLAFPVGHGGRNAVSYGVYRWATVHRFVRSIQQHAGPKNRVAFISTSVWPAYPSLIYADRLPGTRYLCAFPVAFFYEGTPSGRGEEMYRTAARQPAEERRFLEELGEDLVRYQPAVVYVSTGPCQACPGGFEIAEYLTHVGWQARFLAGYEQVEQVGRYAVYVRKVA